MYIFFKFIYNEYIGPYFLSHVVARIFASDPPPRALLTVLGLVVYMIEGIYMIIQ